MLSSKQKNIKTATFAPKRVYFECHVISSKFCWMIRSLPPLSSSKMVFKFNADGRIQACLLPSVFGKMSMWMDFGTNTKSLESIAGIHEYTFRSSNEENCLAWLVPIKQLVSILERQGNNWTERLRFDFAEDTCILSLINNKIGNCKLNSMYDDEDEELLSVNMNEGNGGFGCEWKFPVDLIPHPKDLVEFKVLKPSILASLTGLDFRKFLLQCAFAKNSMNRHFCLRLSRTPQAPGSMRLEGDVWADKDNTTHYHFHHDIQQRDLDEDQDENELKTRGGAKCVVLIDSMMRALQAMRILTESPALMSAGSECIMAVLDETAIVFYAQIPITDQDTQDDETGDVMPRMTVYIPAFTP